MSIILKGIDLPTDRKPYGIEVIYRFEGADGLFSEKNYLSPNEAVQIPKGHGRLIDEKQIDIPTTNVSMDCGDCSLLYDFEVMDIIEDAPTILEAEEEDERQ